MRECRGLLFLVSAVLVGLVLRLPSSGAEGVGVRWFREKPDGWDRMPTPNVLDKVYYPGLLSAYLGSRLRARHETFEWRVGECLRGLPTGRVVQWETTVFYDSIGPEKAVSTGEWIVP